MILLNAEKISKGYTDRQLLEQVSFGIDEGDKIGIIGVNGTGKSTLLKILAGVTKPDSGSVTKAGGTRISYLPQNPVFDESSTILQQVQKGLSNAKEDEDDILPQNEAHDFECKTILTKLGFTDLEQLVSQLSGGQKRRVALACALASTSDVLILDEPTNHIDSDMVDWLENFLAHRKGAFIMVTHDRYFLDRVTNKILELQRGNLYTYDQCNYSAYLERKAQREEMQLASERKRQSLYRKELEWIQRGAKARGTKAQYRVNRFREMEEQKVTLDQSKLEISALSARLGKKIIEIDSITKAYDNQSLIKDFSYNLLRGDRVGIIGPNGCGKSTLLQMIAGNISPDSGEIQVGETVKIGYFSQECAEMDISMKAIDYIRTVSQEIKTPDGTLTATQMMERFLFSTELQYTEISQLSGGERRRLFLLRILMDAPNVLLLDEPTNDLDIETLTILEDYLESFPGAVIAVSHDRYFLDKIMDHVFVFVGDGKIKHYIGGYTDYRAEAIAIEKEKKKASASPDQQKSKARPRSEKLKFSFKEQREFDEIDTVIAELESHIEQTEKEMEQQSSDYTRLQELTAEKESLESQLTEKMERWVYLNDLADQIEAQKNDVK